MNKIVRAGAVDIAFVLATNMDLNEPYYCRLLHIDGFGPDPVMVQAATMVKPSLVGREVEPLLGFSHREANLSVPMHEQYLPAAHALIISKLNGKPFPDDYDKTLKDFTIVMRITPESWLHRE